MLVFEDETTITQKPCLRKWMIFERRQQKIEHNGGRKKFSAYMSLLLLLTNYYRIMAMLVIGCISAQLLFLVAKTYEPVTST